MLSKAEQLARLMGGAPLTVKAATDSGASGALYRAGSTSRRAIGWRAPTTYPNANLGSLHLLRDRSRAAARDDGYAAGVLVNLVSNIIGTGIKPLSGAPDQFRNGIEELWKTWTDESDADGLLDFYGQQAQAVRAWLEAGEIFLRIRNRRESDGMSVPMQIQVIEPELCPYEYTTKRGRNNIRAGIEFNRIGRRVAYYFYDARPGDPNDLDTSRLVRIPADQILHIYKPLRAGQLRGTPHLTQALVRLRELDAFDDATLLRQKLSAMFVAFLKQMSGDSTVEPITGEPVENTVGERPVLVLEPGAFQELEPGEEVQFSDPPGSPGGYNDYMRQQLYAVASATGVPYEVLTGDMSRVNDRTVRVVLAEFRRRIQADQHQTVVFQLCRPVWTAWMFRAVLSGALALPADYATNPKTYEDAQWMPQGWPYLHPVQDVTAQKEAIRNGLTSRAAVVSELGEDAAVIDRQQSEDNDRADELGLKYDSDSRSGSGGAAPGQDGQFGEGPQPAPAPAPEPDPEPEPDDPEDQEDN